MFRCIWIKLIENGQSEHFCRRNTLVCLQATQFDTLASPVKKLKVMTLNNVSLRGPPLWTSGSYNNGTLNASQNGSSDGGSDDNDTEYQTWARHVIPWVAFGLMLAAFLLNGLCLVAFCREKRLRTVFNLYLISLTATDFLYSCISMPSFIVVSYYGPGLWPAGLDYCGKDMTNVTRLQMKMLNDWW